MRRGLLTIAALAFCNLTAPHASAQCGLTNTSACLTNNASQIVLGTGKLGTVSMATLTSSVTWTFPVVGGNIPVSAASTTVSNNLPASYPSTSPNYQGLQIDYGGFPTSGFVQSPKVRYETIVGSLSVPASVTTPEGGAFATAGYCLTASSVGCGGLFGLGLVGHAGAFVWGVNPQANDFNTKDYTPGTSLSYAAGSLFVIEADAGVSNPGTNSVFGISARRPYSTATAIVDHAIHAESGNLVAAGPICSNSAFMTNCVYFSGTLNDLNKPTQWSGGPIMGSSMVLQSHQTICMQVSSTGTPDMFKWWIDPMPASLGITAACGASGISSAMGGPTGMSMSAAAPNWLTSFAAYWTNNTGHHVGDEWIVPLDGTSNWQYGFYGAQGTLSDFAYVGAAAYGPSQTSQATVFQATDINGASLLSSLLFTGAATELTFPTAGGLQGQLLLNGSQITFGTNADTGLTRVNGTTGGLVESNNGTPGNYGGYRAGRFLAVQIPVPTGLIATPATAGSANITYEVVAKLADGSANAAVSATVSNSTAATLNSTNNVLVQWTASTGATSYDVYRTAYSGSCGSGCTRVGKISNTALTSLTDTGASADGSTPPMASTNTSGALVLSVPTVNTISLIPGTAGGQYTLTLPSVSGNLITSSDTGTVTGAMLANPIALGHALAGSTAPPTIVAGFGTSPSIAGGDFAGRITVGTGTPSSGTISFGTSYTTNAPSCVANDETTQLVVRANASTSGVTLSSASSWSAGTKLTWACVGY